MLTLILGRAGSGKTAYVMNDIKKRMAAGETGLYLLVPEQYSHDAERQLCSVCGDRLSLHGEALSFTRLCSRVFSETGATAAALDAGGQILVMRRALESVAPGLRVFGNRGVKAEFLEKLLAAVREFKSLGISPVRLGEISQLAAGSRAAGGPLCDKLHDLSLIMGAFDAFFGDNASDPAARLDRLAEKIPESTFGDTGHIYLDGFNDFTAQELKVIEEFIKKDAGLTCCLTCGQSGGGEIFTLPLKTAGQLERLAAEYGVETRTVYRDISGGRAGELAFLERMLFEHTQEEYNGVRGAVNVYSAATVYAECEIAAHKVLELVRTGYRWREIGVMARDWQEYGPVCENVFDKYGVEYFSAGKSDILQKPPVALIDAALEIIVSGWEYSAVFKYLKTGLCGISCSDCAELENYVLKWGIRGSAWVREDDWTLPPSGYGGSAQLESDALSRINACRRAVITPLLKLRDGIRGISEVSGKLRALYWFMEEIRLPEQLEEKATELNLRGELRLADEYVQLWNILKTAMEQFYTILGDTRLDTAEFRRMLALMLSQYSVGVIPVALDRTALGDMAMSRRRDLKCLIILGAQEGALPKLTPDGGIFSVAERDEMIKLGTDMPAGQEDRLCREMNMIYSVLTLPTEKLVLTYKTADGGRPSFIVKRIKALLGLSEIILSEEEYMSAAEGPCFELAAIYGTENSAAGRYFGETGGEAAAKLAARERVIARGRTKLSPDTAEALYGRGLSLSPSRADSFYSCAFAHFLKNGLRLLPRIPAGFDAPAAGTFTHFVLENVSHEIKRSVGFKNADEGLIREATLRYIEKYSREKLFGFEGKNERFRYLFERLAEDTERVVLDMMAELKHSDFIPLNFELDLAKLTGDCAARGITDRVDGWRRGGELYLRVVDYKTGKKPFLLSDVYRGMGMQMLIYLAKLQKYGGARYGGEIKPAGVLYIPARDIIVKAPRNASEDEIKKLRERDLRRSGLVLGDAQVLEAMENGEEKKYLPVKTTKDGYSGDAVVSENQLLLLSEHVEKMLDSASKEILSGGISCQPYYKNENDNACLYCQYRAACAFSEDLGDRRRYFGKMSAEEVWQALSGRDFDNERE